MTDERGLTVAALGEREMVMTRVFDAPRERVFDALTRPELVKRWLLGPPGRSMPVCEINLKAGGSYRYVWRRDSDGTDMAMGGVYREVAPPTGYVCSERFEVSWYPGEALVTAVLVEERGQTTLTTTIRYESQAARDGVLKFGIERGVAASYDRLDPMLGEPK